MSEKMREDFEDWALAEAEKRSYKFMDSLFKLSPIDDGYLTTWVDCAWMGWKASRAALVVELPSDINGEYYADGWNAALMCVEGILEEAGVSYK